MSNLVKKQSVAYRAVIVAVLMVSSVAITGVGAATSVPVSLDAQDWQVSNPGESVTDNATNGGIDIVLTSDSGASSATSIVESTGETTLYFEVSATPGRYGIPYGVYLYVYEPNGVAYTLVELKGYQSDLGAGSATIDVTAGTPIKVGATSMFGFEEARVTLSPVPIESPNTNSPPEAALSAPASAVQGQPITLDAAGSSDPDGDALTFAWDLDSDSAYDDATGATIQHSFADPGVQTVSVEVSDGTDTDTADATIEVARYAPVDVKPGSDKNPVNPKAKGVLPVAILHTDDFDPTAVVVESLVLSATEGGDGASPAHSGHFEDIDGDGDDDLVVHFTSADLGLASTSSTLSLSGEMADGISLVGTGDVTVVGTDKGNNGNGRGR